MSQPTEYPEGAPRRYESINGTSTEATARCAPDSAASQCIGEPGNAGASCGVAAAKPANAIGTYSESFRHSCEVRHVASLPDRAARKAYLAGIRSALGEKGEPRIASIIRDLKAMKRSAA